MIYLFDCGTNTYLLLKLISSGKGNVNNVLSQNELERVTTFQRLIRGWVGESSNYFVTGWLKVSKKAKA